MRYLKNVHNKRVTPQSQPIPGSKQVKNSAGGFSFAVNDWTRLERFLVLGSEGGSYYAKETTLTIENADAVVRCLKADGIRTVNKIVEISEAGRAPKNEPAIFALALAASVGDDATRREALKSMPKVCRTGTHLFHFAQFVDGMRGWGRGLRDAVGRWYDGKPVDQLAYQAIKYQQRDGWSHRDLLRLSHPVPKSTEQRTLYHWITQGWPDVGTEPHPDKALQMVWAFERAKRAQSADEICSLIREYRLPREAVPTEYLTEASVWEALLAEMPMTAMIRNLATMTRAGLLTGSSDATAKVVEALGNGQKLHKARVHPIAVLSALKTYAQGHGVRGQNSWEPVSKIVDALDGAFYTSFRNVTPTGKRWTLALDVSGSMGCGVIAGIPGLTPRVASAAMAMITAAVESKHEIVAFSSARGGYGGQWGGGQSGITRVALSPRQRLDDIITATDAIPFGGTDCALPMIWAAKEKIATDIFVIYTDSETWHGEIHPVQALQEYRQKTGIPAKLAVVGMVSNGFTIADPEDAGMLDVVGFDTATPQLMSDFAG